MKDFIELLRAMVRPFLAIWFSVTWVIFVFTIYSSGGTIADVPLQYTAIVVGIVGWWYYDRSKGKRRL